MDTLASIRPRQSSDVADAIADAVRDGARLEITGGGSKSSIGAPAREAVILDMSGFAGVIDYDPAELVLTVGAATPLADVQALVAGEGQRLAFEPFDHGPIFGRAAGRSTIGGIVAAGVAGSRRLSAGGARDHLLRFEGVSGRGEAFVAGAKVVKNVTGYDLPKLVCGSWGRLIALTQLTLKVLPDAFTQATLVVERLAPRQAQAAMARAMGSQAEVSAAAHVPGFLPAGTALTALRLEGFGPSVAARSRMLEATLSGFGTVRTLSPEDAEKFWTSIRTLAPLHGDGPLWRINVPPSASPDIVETLARLGADWLLDWAGGLIWASGLLNPDTVRHMAQAGGGHATLMRAPDGMRSHVPAFHPPAPAVAKLEARVRRAFDPLGVFETDRFLDCDHAH